MAWYDTITSYFSSESQSETPPPTPAAAAYPSPSLMLSTHYSLANLTLTSQVLTAPNLPLNPVYLSNLQYTAHVCEQLEAEIGPFNIISGFRTTELQNKLSAQGEPTGSGTSYHEIGLGVDIYPTTMSLDEFFGKMLANESIKNLFAEIAIKPSQNTIHLGIKPQGASLATKVLGLTEEGKYGKLSLSDIAKYIEPFMESAEAATDYAAAKLVSYNRAPLILGMVAAFGGVIYMAFASGERRRANPRVRVKPIKQSFMSDATLAHLSVPALQAMKKRYARWNRPNVAMENRWKQLRFAMAVRELERRRKAKYGA